VLDAVGDEAMKYYAELGEQATPAETLKRAIALRQIGEVRFAQGRFDAALTAFAESRSQAELPNRLDPANATAVRGLLAEAERAPAAPIDVYRGLTDLARQIGDAKLMRSVALTGLTCYPADPLLHTNRA